MSRKVINRDSSIEDGTVSFEVIDTGDSLVCNLRDIFGDLYDQFTDVAKHLACHSVNAKVGDSAASPESDRITSMRATWENLTQGVWAMRGEGGSGTRVTQLQEAVARATGKDIDEVRAWLDGLSDDDKKEVQKHPQVISALADIKAEKATAAKKAAAKAAKDSAPLQIGA